MKSKKKSKILFISQEIFPYLPESELSKQGRYLPQAMQERGRETRTFMPKFGDVNDRRNQLHEVIRLSGMNLIINDTDHPLTIKVASIPSARIQVYFIDSEDFFMNRNILADDNGEEYDDNSQRAIFYIRGVMETVKKLRWTPDVIHCQGWISSLAPLYIKKAYNDDPFFKNSKVVFTLQNDEFKKPFSADFPQNLLLDGIVKEDLESINDVEITYEALTKLAIDFSDGVIQASETVNKELVKYVEKKKIKFLPYVSNEDYADDFLNFYEGL